MKLEQARPIVKPLNINLGKLIKIELVKALQSDEGNIACFATAYSGVCDQVNCYWRMDCFAASKPN